MTEALNRYFSNEDVKMAKESMEKIKSKSSEKCKSKSQGDITSHLLKWLLSKIRERVGYNVEQREPLCTGGRNVNWNRHCGKEYGGFSKT